MNKKDQNGILILMMNFLKYFSPRIKPGMEAELEPVIVLFTFKEVIIPLLGFLAI